MQTFLLPAARSGNAPPSFTLTKPSLPTLRQTHSVLNSHSSSTNQSLSFTSTSLFSQQSNRHLILKNPNNKLAPAPISVAYNEYPEQAKLAQVAKRLDSTSRYFKRLGSLGFWGQLVSTIVAAVILSFSVVITGKVTSPATFYATAGGIVAAFISVFMSFGYIRLSDRLRKTVNNPEKAPPRSDVINSLKTGIVVNILGMGAAILGMQATVGLLVAKALTTSSSNSYYRGIAAGNSPILALDVFLVQASANTILSHFLGLVFSLELLRSVTVPPSDAVPVARAA
ncbi:protein TIC 21, chloroplastic-like [Rutidosis leptorrhynchoides]|uniref:protein TIC 21, chloroplastic-like n=1 Tax=Rutidosis leptorrhynchoides TaxID=125765 RepID=UPI003A9A0FDC